MARNAISIQTVGRVEIAKQDFHNTRIQNYLRFIGDL